MGNFSKVFSKQLPRFVREDYPLFVSFIEKYLEFVESTAFVDKNIHDLNKTHNNIKIFLDALKKELAFNLPKPVSQIAEDEFLTKIKELYVSKGSEESIKFIFKAFFNKDVELFIPSTQILTPSEGEWIQEYSIFVRTIAGDPYLTQGKVVNVLTREYNVKLEVIRVNTSIGQGTTGVGALDLGYVTEVLESMIELGFISEDITDILSLPQIGEETGEYHELIIDRNYSGMYKVGDIVQFSENNNFFVGYIVPTLGKCQVLSEGKGFRLGQTLDIQDEIREELEDGSQGQILVAGDGVRLKLSKIGKNGSVKAAQIIRFGVEYPRSFMIGISSNPLRIVSKTIFKENSIDFFLEDRITRYEDRGSVIDDFGYAFNEGSVINYIITNPGKDYTAATCTISLDFNPLDYPDCIPATITPIISNGSIISFIISGGSGYPKVQGDVLPLIITGNGTEATAVVIFGQQHYTSIEYFGNELSKFWSTINYNYDPIENQSFIKLLSGPVAKYPGYYNNNKSFLSDSICLIDSSYYQRFSYVIKTDMPLTDYRSLIGYTVHPAGYKLFAEYTLVDVFNISTAVEEKTKFIIGLSISGSANTLTLTDTVDSQFNPVLNITNTKTISDIMSAVDVVCLYNNPYSVPVGIPDQYFGENYSLGNTCSVTDDMNHNSSVTESIFFYNYYMVYNYVGFLRSKIDLLTDNTSKETLIIKNIVNNTMLDVIHNVPYTSGQFISDFSEYSSDALESQKSAYIVNSSVFNDTPLITASNRLTNLMPHQSFSTDFPLISPIGVSPVILVPAPKPNAIANSLTLTNILKYYKYEPSSTDLTDVIPSAEIWFRNSTGTFTHEVENVDSIQIKVYVMDSNFRDTMSLTFPPIKVYVNVYSTNLFAPSNEYILQNYPDTLDPIPPSSILSGASVTISTTDVIINFGSLVIPTLSGMLYDDHTIDNTFTFNDADYSADPNRYTYNYDSTISYSDQSARKVYGYILDVYFFNNINNSTNFNILRDFLLANDSIPTLGYEEIKLSDIYVGTAVENTPTPNDTCPVLYPDDAVTITYSNEVNSITISAIVISPDYNLGGLEKGFKVTLLSNLTLLTSTDPLTPTSGYNLLEYIFNNYSSPLVNGTSAAPSVLEDINTVRTYAASYTGLRINTHNPYAINIDYIQNMPADLLVLSCDYVTGGDYPYPANQ